MSLTFHDESTVKPMVGLLHIDDERKRFLQQLSAIVARRNYAIFDNASPRRGGEAPAAPPIDYE
jgi:hypothetical protein